MTWGMTRPPPPAGLAVAFAVLSVGWAMAVPPFEKPDEISHYAYGRMIADEARLPVQGSEALLVWSRRISRRFTA